MARWIFVEAAQSIMDFEQEGLEIVSLFCDDAHSASRQAQEAVSRSTKYLLLHPAPVFRELLGWDLLAVAG